MLQATVLRIGGLLEVSAERVGSERRVPLRGGAARRRRKARGERGVLLSSDDFARKLHDRS